MELANIWKISDFEMNFEYKVITEVAGQYNTGRYNTGNCLFSRFTTWKFLTGNLGRDLPIPLGLLYTERSTRPQRYLISLYWDIMHNFCITFEKAQQLTSMIVKKFTKASYQIQSSSSGTFLRSPGVCFQI